MAQYDQPKGTNTRQQDEDLIEACIQGDTRAWSRFVERYGRLVYAVSIRMGLPRDACEDVFQNVLTTVFGELPRIRDRASLPKWLMTVSHRESCRWLRKARSTAPLGPSALENVQTIQEELPEMELLRLERQQLVHEALEQLGSQEGQSGRCRELITSLFFDSSTPDYKEISRRLQIPVGAIGPTRNRCLQKLLRLLGSRLEDETR